jgi:uncharacterized protein DUF1565
MIWYVDSTGSDAYDGRRASTAFKTLGHAIRAASPGDAILIKPGAYEQDLPVLLSAARLAGIRVSVMGSE